MFLTIKEFGTSLSIHSISLALSFENNSSLVVLRVLTLAKSSGVNIPLIGTVTAGQPIFAYENYEDYYTFPAGEFRGEELFMLQVKGDSMIEAGIFDGDKIIAISVNDLNNVDFQDTILLQYDESKTNDGYKAKIYLLFNNNKEFDSAFIEISYNKSVAMWDELKDVSWFEVK